MREALAQIENRRDTFLGTFVRFGVKGGWKGPVPTVLLKEVKNENNETLTDHLWFNLTKGFEKLNLQEGDTVKFNARVKPYFKGYLGYVDDVDDTDDTYYEPLELDYKLSNPRKVQRVSNI
jgi:hypothetical protein